MVLDFPSTIKSIFIYNASFGTRELGPALLSAIRSTYPTPWNVHIVHNLEYDREDILYIIICPAGLRNPEKMPIYYINWQLEHVTGTYNNPRYLNLLKGALYNWDYSLYNIKVLKERDEINEIYVPPGYNETISASDIVNNQYIYTDDGKDIDILFLGYCDAYPKRLIIRDNCHRTGYKVWFVSDLDIEGMKNAIRRSKVCINFSVHEDFVFQKIRMNILLSNQACIVTETSVDKDFTIDAYQKNGVTFVPYELVVQRACELVDNFELRKKLAIKSYQWYRNNCYWNKIVDFNSLLPST